MSESTIRVLLVDDQDLIRTGFRLILQAEPEIEVVGEAADGLAALARLREAAALVHVVLMDVRMPGMNGIDATAAIVREFPETRVIVLTTFDLDEYALAAIRAGASGFLLKDARPEELVDAIHRVAAGDAAMAPSVTLRLMRQLAAPGQGGEPNVHAPLGFAGPAGGPPGDGHPASPAQAQSSQAPTAQSSPLTALTEREREVFGAIAEGLNNQEIGQRLFLSESTVKTHVGRVLFKLDLRDRVHAVIFAHEHGV
ncbi:response regulator transcription factor [Leucobacter sp. M11]|uniref:response regulator transcription factor n=1 Tax=Leucobacter sp. M11 TaxID=2993565 RepID=UPI002D7EDBCA|nr:response regulator transcription factor [Leucobacter sp. M11]MEB4615248.1 response regulator transcription factor [Leucobacter sp. M11]